MEKHKWRVFESRVLRRTFGCMRVEVTGRWRKLHFESSIIVTLHQVLLG
jgi:hypothetical protein